MINLPVVSSPDHSCTWRDGYMKIADEGIALLRERDEARKREALLRRRVRLLRKALLNLHSNDGDRCAAQIEQALRADSKMARGAK